MGVSPSWSRVGGSRWHHRFPSYLTDRYRPRGRRKNRKQINCPPAHPHPPISSGSALSAQAAPHRSVRSTRRNILRPPSILCIPLFPFAVSVTIPLPQIQPPIDPSRSSLLLSFSPTRTQIENWNTTVTWACHDMGLARYSVLLHLGCVLFHWRLTKCSSVLTCHHLNKREKQINEALLIN
jgi:hypothetical protein